MAASREDRLRYPLGYRQRGAIGIFAGVVLMLALLFTALAVDAGRLWMEKRRLQTVADMAALEGARNMGCGGSMDALTGAQAAAVRNGYTDNLSNAPNKVETGWIGTSSGLRTFVTTSSKSYDKDAVHVHATKEVPASLVLGGLWGSKVRIAADATARADPPHASFMLGSRLLRLGMDAQDKNLLNALLGGLLGSSLGLDVASYEGLAKTKINLADLVKLQGVSTVDELLDADLGIANMMSLTAAAVNGQSVVDVNAMAAMNTLVSATVRNATLRFGDVLDVAVPASRAAAEAGINVLDLVTTAAMVANGTHAVDLTLGITGISTIHLEITQAPQIAVGPPGRSTRGDLCTEARTAQVSLKLDFLNGLNVINLFSIDLDMALRVSVAQSRANLTSLKSDPGLATVSFDVTPGIADLRLTRRNDATKPGLLRGKLLFGLIVIDVAKIGLNLPIADPGNGQLVFGVPYPIADNLPAFQSTHATLGGSLANALGQAGALNVELLGAISLSNILSPLLPILSSIGGSLLDPLLKLLGVELGGADVILEEVQYGVGAELVI